MINQRVTKITSSLLLMLTLIGLVGCEKKYREMDEVRRTVRAYNDMLAKCHYDLTVEPMLEVATEVEANRVAIFVEKLKFDKQRMKAEIKEFTFVKIGLDSKEVRSARTHEVWSVSHYSLETGEIINQPETITYDLDYVLKKEGNKWLVDRVQMVDQPKK